MSDLLTIKDVTFKFDGSAMMKVALRRGDYTPEDVADRLKTSFYYAAEGCGEYDSRAVIGMSAGPEKKDVITLSFVEYQDYDSDDYDETKELRETKQIEFVIPEIVGEREWRRYQDILALRSYDPARVYALDEDRKKMHDQFGIKFNEALIAQGLQQHFESTSNLARDMIALFNEYRHYAYNPADLAMVLR